MSFVKETRRTFARYLHVDINWKLSIENSFYKEQLLTNELSAYQPYKKQSYLHTGTLITLPKLAFQRQQLDITTEESTNDKVGTKNAKLYIWPAAEKINPSTNPTKLC